MVMIMIAMIAITVLIIVDRSVSNVADDHNNDDDFYGDGYDDELC